MVCFIKVNLVVLIVGLEVIALIGLIDVKYLVLVLVVVVVSFKVV